MENTKLPVGILRTTTNLPSKPEGYQHYEMYIGTQRENLGLEKLTILEQQENFYGITAEYGEFVNTLEQGLDFAPYTPEIQKET